jgi:exopolysaccharide production protein ExoZ
MDESDRRLPALQALRGIAASLVVFFHFAQLYQERTPTPSWIHDSGFGDLGACGVDLFFVISGFIMVYTTRTKAGGNGLRDTKLRSLYIRLLSAIHGKR